jgi:hypothetical protein
MRLAVKVWPRRVVEIVPRFATANAVASSAGGTFAAGGTNAIIHRLLGGLWSRRARRAWLASFLGYQRGPQLGHARDGLVVSNL